jgi:O-antigen/teichoic acid export membrane protein
MYAASRVARNTLILYIRMGITVFISLYVTRLILAALGEEDFGIFNVVGGAISMLLFLNSTMTRVSQRFMSFAQGENNRLKQKQIFNVSIIIHIITAFFIVIVLEVASFVFFNGVLSIPEGRIYVAKLLYQVMVFSTFMSIISVPYDAVINAHENMLLFAVIATIEVILKLIIALYITVTDNDKLVMYGILLAIIPVISMILKQIYCHRKYSEVCIHPIKFYNKTLIKEMSAFGGWTFLGSSASMFSYYGLGIVLNSFFGTVINAAQGVANQMSAQLTVLSSIMLKALNPVIAKSEGAGNRMRMLKSSILGSKFGFFLSLILYMPVFLEMPYVFKLWLKETPEYTIIFCRLMLLRTLFEQLYLPLNEAIAAVGDIKHFQIVTSILLLFPLVVGYALFLYGFQPYAIYVVFAILAFVRLLVTLYYSQKKCGLIITDYLTSVIIPCLTVTLIVFSLASIPLLLLEIGMVRLLVVLFTSSVVFLLSIWFIGLKKDEQQLVLNTIKIWTKKR